MDRNEANHNHAAVFTKTYILDKVFTNLLNEIRITYILIIL